MTGQDSHLPHFAFAVGIVAVVVGQNLEPCALQVLLCDLVDLARCLLHCGCTEMYNGERQRMLRIV